MKASGVVTTRHVWWNGRIVPGPDATIPVSTFGLHYGLGVFEGIRCYRRHDGRPAIFRLREHIERLYSSARIASFEIPFAPAALESACAEVMRANALDEAYIRPIAFTGAGALGIGATDNPIDVAVLCWPWAAILGSDVADKGLRANVSSYVRGHANAVMSKAKLTGQYALSVMAKRESQRLGFDDAIMLDAQGRVAEATAANLFIVEADRLITPPTDLPILAGITRDAIITLARAAGIEVIERAFARDTLVTCAEAFLTGTGAEIAPIREIDGRTIGTGRPGPITATVQQAFARATRGPGELHPGWLSYV